MIGEAQVRVGGGGTGVRCKESVRGWNGPGGDGLGLATLNSHSLPLASTCASPPTSLFRWSPKLLLTPLPAPPLLPSPCRPPLPPLVYQVVPQDPQDT